MNLVKLKPALCWNIALTVYIYDIIASVKAQASSSFIFCPANLKIIQFLHFFGCYLINEVLT